MKSGAHDYLEKDRARGVELRQAVSQPIEKAEQRRWVTTRERELIEQNRAPEVDRAALWSAPRLPSAAAPRSAS
jgi:hypothetical protein